MREGGRLVGIEVSEGIWWRVDRQNHKGRGGDG